MQLNPRYGTDPIIVVGGSPSAIAEPVVRQRRRLVEVLAALDDQQWAAPSRCEGWTNCDVIVHLDSTNAFWAFSVRAGLGGEPTRFLATFDPVASPAQLVDDAGDRSPAEVLAAFRASTDGLVDLLGGLDDEGWRATAEAPPGHLAVSALAHHALWDSWVHERDILSPLGLDQQLEDDEVAASLRYVATLAPGFALSLDQAGVGRLGVEVTDPDLAFVVDVDGTRASVADGPVDGCDLVLRGDAVTLLEALSIRRPLERDVPSEHAWMVAGLATIFDG